jgi:hypothetical protein
MMKERTKKSFCRPFLLFKREDVSGVERDVTSRDAMNRTGRFSVPMKTAASSLTGEDK